MMLKISKWLFLILIVSLPLVRPFNVRTAGLQIPFTDFIFVAVFIFWLIALYRREFSFQRANFYCFLAFYGLALTISTVFSHEPQKSFFKLFGEFYLFGLAVLALHFAAEKTFLKQIFFAWLIGTFLTFAASFAGFLLFYLGYKTQADNYFLSHFGSLPAGNYPRIHALFANANMMTNYLNVSLMLAILAGEIGWLKKVYSRLIQAGIWFAAIFTFSAGLGGMFLSLGLWFWSFFSDRKRVFQARSALAAGVILAVLVFASTLISPDTKNSSLEIKLPLTEKIIEPSVRVLVWQNAFENIQNFPFIGKGTGTDAAKLKYQTLSGDSQVLLDAHNVWLNIAAQTGVFGLLAFLMLIVFLCRKCRFFIDESSDRMLIQKALSCAFFGAFLYQGLSGSFEDARHLWILFGLLVGNSTFSESDTSEASKVL